MNYVEISQPEYQKYQEKWAAVVPKDLTPFPSSYFKPDGKWLYGYEIDIPDLKKENVNVMNVVFSFVIDDNNIVRIVLFGADNDNYETLSLIPSLTQYYMLDYILSPLSVDSWSIKDEIKKGQAEDWTRAWGMFIDNDSDLFSTLFQVSDPRIKKDKDNRLMCHSFPYLEINKTPSVKTLRAYFAIHQPPLPNNRPLLTFVVQWVPTDENANSSYFDLSQPCPPCCPGCP